MELKSNKGITFLELILTMAILAILAGIVIPKIDTSEFLLKTQAQKLCADIRIVRHLAMTEGVHYIIYIDTNHRYYTINLGIKELKRIDMPKNIMIYHTHEVQKLKFKNDGAPNKGNTLIVKNIDTHRSMKITIVPTTGRILLKDEIFKE